MLNFLLIGLTSLSCYIFLCADGFAQSSLGDIKHLFTVDEIEVVGTKRVEPEAITDRVNIQEGEALTNYSLRDAIKSIYSLNYFSEVEAKQVSRDGKQVLQIHVVEKPVIHRIEFMGNSGVSESDLKDQIKTRIFSILDVNGIKKDMVELQKYYEEKGYYLANISYELEDLDDDSKKLIFHIREYDKVRVKRIMFLGNRELNDDELKSFMQTKEESLFSGLSGSGNFKEFNFQTDIERLIYLYKTKGHLQVNIGTPSITVSEDKKWIFITVKINEGPKFSVNNIFYNGELLFTTNEMGEKTSLKSEDIYSEETLRQDIQALTEMYQDEGYAFANVLRNLQIVPGQNKVDIHYSFEKGDIAYFGKIIVKGNTKTRDKVIRRELRIHEGMRYSGSQLRISRERVNRLGFFEPGSVIFNTVSPPGMSNVLDLEISVKERQTGQISIGAGYSTATQGFFQASIAQNNFSGLGQNLNLNVSYSEIQQTYNLGFTEPYFLDTQWTAGADIYRTQSSLISSFLSERHGANLRVGHPIYDYTRLFVTVRHEETNIQNVRNPTIDEDIENGISATIQMSLRHDRRNNVFEPTDGHFGSASLEYAGFYGDQKWLKAILEGRYYEPIYKDLVFRTRVRVEQLMKTSDRELPRTEKFQMGGPRNMRGYDFEDIGPRKLLKDRITGQERMFNIGGTLSLLTTFELESPLIKEAGLKWVVFYDAGNVFEEPIKEEVDYSLRQNYGFGFRWFSPIGVLRFEFGYPIDPGLGQEGQQFHFDIGQLF